MSTLSDSYSNFINPINTGASSSRQGGDSINISYTQGKKSNKSLLEELALKQAQLTYDQASQVPAGQSALEAQWAAEDQAMQQAQETRSAASAAQTLEISKAQEARAAAEAQTKASYDAIALRQAQLAEQDQTKARYAQAAAINNANAAKAGFWADPVYGGRVVQHRPVVSSQTPMEAYFQKLASVEMPAFAAQNAQKRMAQGYDPMTAYGMAFTTYTGRDPNRPLSQSEKEQYAQNSYNAAAASKMGGIGNLQDAYARLIYNADKAPSQQVNSGYTYSNGRWIYAPNSR